MLGISKELFELVLVKLKGKERDAISGTGKGGDCVWHEDVQLFSVWSEDSSFVGYLYLDLHPREGKFGHAANSCLHQGFKTSDGSRRYPATALVCNFSTPTANRPSLLRHSEVTTMFHELGHGIHSLVSRTKYSKFHGTNTTRDFVEVPSKMLEHWCWDPRQLKALSKHWSYLSPEHEKKYMESMADPNASTEDIRSDEKMPNAMIEALVRTRYVNEALADLRLVHYSVYDMMIHQPKSHSDVEKLDVVKLFNKLRHDLCMVDDLGDAEDWHWGNGAAIFGHVMGGYDSALYCYLLAEAYSADMFHTRFSQDPMNKEMGKQYRDIMLKPGGSRDAMELIKEFLGREPSTKAFYKDLGIA